MLYILTRGTRYRGKEAVIGGGVLKWARGGESMEKKIGQAEPPWLAVAPVQYASPLLG